LIENLQTAVNRKIKLLTAKRKWVNGELYDPKPSVQNLIDQLKERRADRTWVIDVLSTLHFAGVESVYFSESYTIDREVKPKLVDARAHNQDGFFPTTKPIDVKYYKQRMHVPGDKEDRLKTKSQKLSESIEKLLERQKNISEELTSMSTYQ
jgi:hypothetical protein